MINHDHKFIFVHIPKTGGTSIEYFFTKETEVNYKHFSPLDWQKHFPKEWSNYFKFSSVRNPWDKVVSQWAMQSQRHGKENFKSFKEFVKYTTGFPLRPQLWYLSDPKHTSHKDIIDYVESNINFIIRFENLQADFNKLCAKVGVNAAALPHKYDSTAIRKGRPYQEYYDTEIKDIISRIYNIDIEYFQYEF